MPGVPPNAFAVLKEGFKNLLRPNRRRRQQEQQAQAAQQQQDEQAEGASNPDVPSHLPPTHPLATGQHSEPQTVSPMPEAAAAPAVVAGSEGDTKEQEKKEDEDKAPVSPVAPAPVAQDEAPKSTLDPAILAEQARPPPPPKIHEDNDHVFNPPLRFDASGKPIPARSENVKPSENAKPSVTAPESTTASATAATAPTPASETQAATKTSLESARDEKMPVMAEEPPEIKAKAAAPGMSATSGPLDDFPIEDDKP